MQLAGDLERIQPKVEGELPAEYRRRRGNAWTRANPGKDVDCFLEGPAIDRDGRLYFVDIPFGRIFRMDRDGRINLIAEYDGWPNGLKIHRDGRLFVADFKRGVVIVQPTTGEIVDLVSHRNSESFKGLNDLVFASNGDLYFTDQGHTGLHDASGRVFRLTGEEKLECLIDTIPSPNGICFNRTESLLYVAVTRANAVWRLPLRYSGDVSKVGAFIQLSGGFAGPDGMALDEEGGLIVCHIGIGVWRFNSRGVPTHLIETDVGTYMTNVCFGGADRRTLFITESDSGTILSASMPFAGVLPYSQS